MVVSFLDAYFSAFAGRCPNEEKLMNTQQAIMSQLSQAILAGLIGGQMEIRTADDGPIYRGELSELKIDDGNDDGNGKKLHAKFLWAAKSDDGAPASWVKHDMTEHAIELDEHQVTNVGPGEGGAGDRWSIISSITGETVMIYPPGDGENLNLAKVELIEPAAA